MLNGLAILGVVLNHAASYGFIAMFWWVDRYLPGAVVNFDDVGGPAYYSLRLIEQLVAYSVPSFLFVSGFFVAFVGGKTIGETWRVARARSWGLLIPYVIWSTVTILARTVLGEEFTPAGWVEMILFGRAAEHYYFIPMLVLLYLASPLLLWGARRRWGWLLAAAAAVQLAVVALPYVPLLGAESPVVNLFIALTPSWFLTTGVFWFCLGLVVCLQLDRLTRWLDQRRGFLGIACVALLALGLLEWESLLSLSGREWIPYSGTIVDSLYAGAFILFFLSLDRSLFRHAKKIGDLGAHSYGIYLVHGLALLFVAKVIYHVAPWLLGYQVIFAAVLAAAGLGLPLALAAAARRGLPRKSYHYLLG